MLKGFENLFSAGVAGLGKAGASVPAWGEQKPSSSSMQLTNEFGRALRPAQRTLNRADFQHTGSITCAANVFTAIGSWTVPVATKLRAGYGAEGAPNTQNGAFYGTVATRTATGAVNETVITGQLRLEIRDSQGRTKSWTKLDRTDLNAVNVSYANRDSRYIFPEQSGIADPNDQLVLSYMPQSTAITFWGEQATIYCDVTLYS